MYVHYMHLLPFIYIFSNRYLEQTLIAINGKTSFQETDENAKHFKRS